MQLSAMPRPQCHLCLQVGQDCPDHAVYVDVASSIDRSTTGSQPGALCLFEDDLSETAWRHTNTGGGCFKSAPDSLHTLRCSPVVAHWLALCLFAIVCRTSALRTKL